MNPDAQDLSWLQRAAGADALSLRLGEPGGGPFERTLDSVTHAELMDRLRTFMEPAAAGVLLGAAVREGEPASRSSTPPGRAAPT